MTSFTTDDGVRLEYVQSGAPAGRPVVLIAGFKAPATSWKYQLSSLERAGHRIIAFDRRNHGTSERTDLGPTMQRHGADLQQLLEHLDLHDAVLVGGSQGGNTIWSTVAQFGTGRVSGIVIVDQTPKMINAGDWPHGFYDYTEDVADTHFATSIPNPGRHSLASKGPVRIARLLRAIAAGGRTKDEERGLSAVDLALLNDHAKADWRDAVAATEVPVLFVAGAESEFWPSSHAAASAALAKHGGSVVIPKDGHAANIEQPKAFNAALLEFIAGLPR